MPDLPDPPVPLADEGADEADDFDDFDEEHEDFLPLKYLFEGLATLADLGAALRRLADDFDERATAGWRLATPIESGHVCLVRDAD